MGRMRLASTSAFPDFDRADLAVVLGSNPYVSQASFVHLAGGSQTFQRLVDRGYDVLWVDPRRTESAQRWGEHLPIRPGTDAYLLLGWLSLLTANASYPHAEGLDELVRRAHNIRIERVSERTGIPVERTEETAERIRRSPKTAFHISVGVNQGEFGTLAYVLLQALAFVTRNFDSEGGLLIHPLARAAARAMEWADLDVVRTSRVGGLPSNMGTLPATIMADEILTPGPERLRALVVIAGDPLLFVPGGQRLARALEELELLVCIDMFENETGKLAHALLPTTSWLERWDVATTSLQLQTHGMLPAAGPVIAPRGKSRNDVRILCDLARGLGGPRALALGLGSMAPEAAPWVPTRETKAGARRRATPPTILGPRARTEVERLEAVVPPEFVLLSRRRRLGHNSWLHGGARDTAESKAWMHPDDLANLGIRQGGQVTIRSSAGAVTMLARPCADIARPTVVIPHGIGTANVNALIPDGPGSVETLSGMATMTGIGVRVAAGAG